MLILHASMLRGSLIVSSEEVISETVKQSRVIPGISVHTSLHRMYVPIVMFSNIFISSINEFESD